MVQQTAIYDQACKLMVGALPFIFRTKGITFIDRMQVRMFSALNNRCLT